MEVLCPKSLVRFEMLRPVPSEENVSPFYRHFDISMSATCTSGRCCCTDVISSLPVILLAMVHCPCTNISCTATGFSDICSRGGVLWASAEDLDTEQLATAHCTAESCGHLQRIWTLNSWPLHIVLPDSRVEEVKCLLQQRLIVRLWAVSGTNTAELSTVVKSVLRSCRASALTWRDYLCYFSPW